MDLLTITNLIISNSVLDWLGLRLVKRIDNHETRISVAEKYIKYARKTRRTTAKKPRKERDTKGRFKQGFSQPCIKGSRVRKAKRG